MRILVLGGDGYLGWPTAMYLSRRGYDVSVLDNMIKRQWETETGGKPLVPIPTVEDRIALWEQSTGRLIGLYRTDLTHYEGVLAALSDMRPEAILHYAEQPSAPYSMIDADHAVRTQVNNVVGTLNLLWAVSKTCAGSHIVKLGTMGQYGTPNIDIEEGFIAIEHNGRRDRLPFPCQPGSFYHLSKVHDSHNMRFATKAWRLAVTDLNQGIVYGIETDEAQFDSDLRTGFHYDHIFGTALNRFCVQAVAGQALTVYGQGSQKRTFINIRDVLQCVELALLNPARPGEYRVFNQFTEVLSLLQLAQVVSACASETLGRRVALEHLRNPRREVEQHYYNPARAHLTDLGLKARLLSDGEISSMLHLIAQFADCIDARCIRPSIAWDACDSDTVREWSDGKLVVERVTEASPRS